MDDVFQTGSLLERGSPSDAYQTKNFVWSFSPTKDLVVDVFDTFVSDKLVETWTFSGIKDSNEYLITRRQEDGVVLRFLAELQPIENEIVQFEQEDFLHPYFNLVYEENPNLMFVVDSRPDGRAANLAVIEYVAGSDDYPDAIYRDVNLGEESYYEWEFIGDALVYDFFDTGLFFAAYATDFVDEINAYEICSFPLFALSQSDLEFALGVLRDYCENMAEFPGTYVNLYVFDESTALKTFLDSGYKPGANQGANKDADEDGVTDLDDEFPFDPSEWLDTDGDTVGDNSDDCPFDAGNPYNGCTLENTVRIEIETPGVVVDTTSNGENECIATCPDGPTFVEINEERVVLMGVYGVGDSFVLRLPEEASGKKFLILDMYLGVPTGEIRITVDDDFEMVYSIDRQNSGDWVSYFTDDDPFFIEFPFDLEGGMHIKLEPTFPFSMGNVDAIRFTQ